MVDDDPQLAEAVRRSLRAGYDVELAGGGAEALERLRRGERFDVIVCDLRMPEMSGMELFGAIKGLSPEQAERTVFVTGVASSPQCAELLGQVHDLWLDEPFAPDQVRALIERGLRR
ncbi:MAG: response regulator [Myxococcaceae bacterium]|nr:response regulator [Myxococcaceae bacterium]